MTRSKIFKPLLVPRRLKNGKVIKRRIYHGLKISRFLRDVIHGYIMSDGYIKETGNLTIDQSTKQDCFVTWMYKKLAHIRTDSPPASPSLQEKRVHSVTGSPSRSKRFNTKSVLHGFHYMWYDPNPVTATKPFYIKVLPKSISCFFSPTFIAVWFAGDGTKILGSKGAKFEVTSFTKDERGLLKQLFMDKYNISTSINRAGISQSGTEQWTLNVNAPDYETFKALLTQETDLIQKCFAYKLHF